MFGFFKRKFYVSKTNMLIKEGLSKGNIVPFEKELYDRLNKIYFVGIPMSMYLKYLKPNNKLLKQGLDRSLFITMGLKEATLARGNVKNLELEFGKEHALHGWVECGKWVYDPTTLLKFKKDLYYKIYEPTNISYSKPEEYTDDTWYQEIIHTALKDLKPNGKKREDLIISVPLIQGYANAINNRELSNELGKYLNKVSYKQKEVI